MKIRNLTSLLLSFWLLSVSIASAQSPAGAEAALKIDTNLVVLDAQVLDKKTGTPLQGLKTEDFVLYEDGVRQKIEYFSVDQLPLSILLLLDVSPSTRPFIEKIQAGALQTLERLKPDDEVAVMYYAGKAKLALDFTRDRKAIVEAIDTAGEKGNPNAPGGLGTALKQGLAAAAETMTRLPQSRNRRVIFAITDDFSHPFGPSGKETAQMLFESGTVVCGLIVRNLAGKLSAATPNVLDGLKLFDSSYRLSSYAEKTGGEILKAGTADVAEKFATVLENLRRRYSLGYVSTNPSADAKFRKIKLNLTDSRQSKSIVVRTRQGYFARPVHTTPPPSQ